MAVMYLLEIQLRALLKKKEYIKLKDIRKKLTKRILENNCNPNELYATLWC